MSRKVSRVPKAKSLFIPSNKTALSYRYMDMSNEIIINEKLCYVSGKNEYGIQNKATFLITLVVLLTELWKISELDRESTTPQLLTHRLLGDLRQTGLPTLCLK